jgi:tRNA(Ile)-lysidine synthase
VNTIEKYGMFAGERAILAVSGGPDSMCLMELMIRLRDRLDIDLLVAHVDHGLNPDSEKVAHDVALRSSEAGIDAHVVRASGLEGPNLQARAREFRYTFFEALADREDADFVVTAHTLDDRVETTLARLIHGAGPRVLTGIRPMSGNRVRPLIECRRSETRAYCDERAIEFYDDPANEDESYERVAVRKRVLSAIEERWGEGAIHAIARSAERTAEDVDALEELASRFVSGLIRAEDDEIRIDLKLLSALPRALRRRALERALGEVRDRAAVIDEVLDSLDSGVASGARFSGPGGIDLVFDKDTLHIVGQSDD